MAAFGRQDDLRRQIPDDVMDRARKAGVSEVDWYAGRLTSAEGTGFTEVSKSRREELRTEARTRRRAARREKSADLATPITNVVAWFRAIGRRSARHAR